MDTIGRYEVVGRIGSGGFATVYRVRDPVLESEVAAKVLAENWTDNSELRDRFMREAQLLRRIDSHRVVTVHDIGDLPSGQPYFVMSLANRGTLEGRLASITTPTHDDILTVASEVADCIRAVHGHDLIHRDIKPSNLLITSSRDLESEQLSSLLLSAERLVLGDFGLAKDVALQATGLTIAAGTGGYAAPEQMNPQGAPDRRTDLYAATAVMYRVISGAIPPSFELLHSTVPFPDHEWWMGGLLGAFFRRGMAFAQHDRHAAIDPWLEEFRAALTGTQSVPSTGATTRAAPWTGGAGPVSGAPSAPATPGPSTPGPVTPGHSGPGPSQVPPVHDPSSDPTRSIPVQSYPQTGQPQPSHGTAYPPSSQPAHPQTGPYAHPHGRALDPTSGQQHYQPPGQVFPPSGYQAPSHPVTSGPSGYGAPSYTPSQRVRKRSIWPWLVAVVTVLAAIGGGGAYLFYQGSGPTIVGPDQIAAGELQVFRASFDNADTFRWTDWNGETFDSDQLQVRGVAPGKLTFSVVAVTDGGTSRRSSRTITITEANDGPEIEGPGTVRVGETETYTYDTSDGSDPEWIDPNGSQRGDTYRITPQGAGSWSITLIVTREDGVRIGTRREIRLVN